MQVQVVRGAALLVVGLLAGCATIDTAPLEQAQREVDLHLAADQHMNVDLIDQRGLTEAERAPLITEKMKTARQCGSQFHAAFLDAWDEADTKGAGANRWFIGHSRVLDDAFSRCIAGQGLVGFVEFKVGERYLRTADFLRSYVAAATRRQQLAADVQAQQQAADLGMAYGFASMGRALAAQPTPAYSFTPPRMPIQCRSYRYGTGVNTTCN